MENCPVENGDKVDIEKQLENTHLNSEEAVEDSADEAGFISTEPGEQVNPAASDVEHMLYVMKNMHFMTTANLRKELKSFKVEARGKRTVVYERLKKCLTKNGQKSLDAMEPAVKKTKKFYDYLVVIDFECTCDEFLVDFSHEIIEFPAVLVDVGRRKVVDSFRSFVRPIANPKLSEFCINLTGITQEIVDESPVFIDVFDLFRCWMAKHNLGKENSRFAFVTDGPWDIAKFFQMQCLQSNIPLPHDFRYYVNIRKIFASKYQNNSRLQKVKLDSMLKRLKMEFEGRKHSGLDDSQNIARIVIRLLQDNATIRVNEMLSKRQLTDQESKKKNSSNEVMKSMWWYNLPYRVVRVNKKSFISGSYLDCESCDEKEEL